MDAQTYYNTLGVQKTFCDPFDLPLIESYLSKEPFIIEYGCGYGRLLNLMKEKGYDHQVGYDFAERMIHKGHSLYPDLKLSLLEEEGKVPQRDNVCDLFILSTILCTLVPKKKQKALIDECYRVLRPGGILYLYDFMISQHSRYQAHYQHYYETENEWGLYENSEGLKVRHHSSSWIFKLLSSFDVQYFAQQEHMTMNNHPIRSFVSITQKPLKTD